MTNAVTPARQPPSFLRVMLFLAATIVVLAGMRLGAPIVTPTLFALVLSLIFSPIYAWLKRRGLPAPVALLIMLVGLSILFAVLFGFLSVSIGRFTGRLAFYTTQLEVRTDELQALLESIGVSNLDLRDVVEPGAILGALGSVLTSLGGFLSDLFLILMITLFLLGEGPAMAASAARERGTRQPAARTVDHRHTRHSAPAGAAGDHQLRHRHRYHRSLPAVWGWTSLCCGACWPSS